MSNPLGRLPFKPDARDWPVECLKELIADGAVVPLQWTPSVILDQGDNGTCVAAGTLGACDCDDEHHVISTFTNADIVPFFDTISGHGALPDGGAEVREGLKAAQKADYIAAYAPLTTQAQILDWVQNHGPIVAGMDWDTGCDSPDAKGFVHFKGTIRGLHCVYGNGDVGGFDFVNSWSDSWGDKGHFYMTLADLTQAMNGDWEAWAIVQAAPTPTPTPTPTPVPPSVKTALVAILAAVRTIEAAIEKVIKGL